MPNLKQVRENSTPLITQRTLAIALGVTERTISSWERSTPKMTLRMYLIALETLRGKYFDAELQIPSRILFKELAETGVTTLNELKTLCDSYSDLLEKNCSSLLKNEE